MYTDQIADQITGRLSALFDGIPRATLRSVVRETLVARETFNTDATHNRRDAAEPPKDHRKDADDALLNMWKRDQKRVPA